MHAKTLLRNTLLITAFALISLMVNSQTVITVSNNITTNTTWTSNNIYLLNGFRYVDSLVTLTIQPGTVIKGDKASKGSLVITRGAKLIADGTPEQPIIFTSNQAAGSRAYGDWGGVIILGSAPVNDPAGQHLIEGGLDAIKGLYGGTNPGDNSGTLRYVRIEFPGIAFQPNNEVNGLTLGGVGSGTTIEHIQVSYSGDDSYEWFGGTVNNKYLIAYRGWDDDFDSDFGFSGKLQFGVVLRDSAIADQSGSNSFESDNNNDAVNGYAGTPKTHPIFSNVSVFGPMQNSSTPINVNFKRAAHLRRNTALCAYNSVFTGYPVGLKLENDPTFANLQNSNLEFKNNIIAGCTNPLDSTGLTTTGALAGWFNSSGNTILANVSDAMVPGSSNYASPGFLPQSGSPLLSGASFSSSNITDAFFTNTTYRGAFGTEDWTRCWADFDPQNANYTTVPINYGFSVNVTQGGTLPSVTLSVDNISGATYNWSSGGTGLTASVTAAGTYTLTVTSARGCIQTQSVNVGTTAIESLADNIHHIRLSPNPNKGSSTLEVAVSASSSASVSITDLGGRELFQIHREFSPGMNKVQLNTSEFANGFYLVSIRNASENKIIKMSVSQ